MSWWTRAMRGLGLAIVGLGLTIWSWYSRVYDSAVWQLVTLICPIIFVIGLGRIIFSEFEAMQRLMTSNSIQEVWLELPLHWRIIYATALLTGIVNYVLSLSVAYWLL
jgi:hypothetical protein